MVLINNGEQESTKKTNHGRRKIPMERIENNQKRMVTFSKRRKGLFNKAAQLCHQYGAKIAIITFTPGGKICSFGHPSADSVISKYLNEGDQPSSSSDIQSKYLNDQNHSSLDDVLSNFLQEDEQLSSTVLDGMQPQLSSSSTMLDGMQPQLDQQAHLSKLKSEYEAVIMEQAMKEANIEMPWLENEDMEQLGMEELKEYISAMERFKINVSTRANQFRSNLFRDQLY